jgi:hypothetical protein
MGPTVTVPITTPALSDLKGKTLHRLMRKGILLWTPVAVGAFAATTRPSGGLISEFDVFLSDYGSTVKLEHASIYYVILI